MTKCQCTLEDQEDHRDYQTGLLHKYECCYFDYYHLIINSSWNSRVESDNPSPTMRFNFESRTQGSESVKDSLPLVLSVNNLNNSMEYGTEF